MIKNTSLIRLALISVSLLVYCYIFKSTKSAAPVAAPAVGEARMPLSLSNLSHVNIVPPAPFVAALKGREKNITVENDFIKVVLSTKGGAIQKVSLKKHKDRNGQELVLLDEKTSHMGLTFPCNNHLLIETKDLYFRTEAASNYQLKTGEQVKINFRLPLATGQYLEQQFEFFGDSYQVHYTWHTADMGAYLNQGDRVSFCWHMDMKSLEYDAKVEDTKSTVNYYLSNQTFDHLKVSSTEPVYKDIRAPIKWVGLKQHFFSSAIIADEGFVTGEIGVKPLLAQNNHVVSHNGLLKSIDLRLSLSEGDVKQGHGGFSFFFGPNDYSILNKVTKGFDKNLSLGFFKWINQGLVIPLFSFLERHYTNYGLIIFLLVIIIKLLLAPLSYKSFVSMAKMKVVKPELDKIKERCGGDMHRVQTEQIAFYRYLGINPLSGCMPILLQLPIILAMLNFFPNMVALRQAPFLWAKDLSTYDSIIQLPFTIPWYGSHISLFGLLTVLSTLYTWSHGQSNAVEGPMKVLSYVFPFTLTFMVNTLPAGLNFYYFISNIVTLLQQRIIKHLVNEEAIKAKLLAGQQQMGGEKSSFQSRVIASIQSRNKKKDSL